MLIFAHLLSPLFQPTPPARTETSETSYTSSAEMIFQPTPPARTETLQKCAICGRDGISTHSAREDGDIKGMDGWKQQNISTHSAREDGDPYRIPNHLISRQFQPTPPARTETQTFLILTVLQEFQPTPPARTETPGAICGSLSQNISTHSAREDGDILLCKGGCAYQ